MADHILDLTENSVRASATRVYVEIRENATNDTYIMEITDNGTGMDKETAQKAPDPFFTSRKTRKVGLGIPLLQQNAERSGGHLIITSEKGKGTLVSASFGLRNMDRPPTGDVADVFLLTTIGHPTVTFTYSHVTEKGSFTLSSAEIRESLGDLPLGSKKIMKAIRELITHNLESIGASA